VSNALSVALTHDAAAVVARTNKTPYSKLSCSLLKILFAYYARSRRKAKKQQSVASGILQVRRSKSVCFINNKIMAVRGFCFALRRRKRQGGACGWLSVVAVHQAVGG